MNRIESEALLAKIPNYKDASHKVSRGIHNEVLKGGDSVRSIVDLLHGTWLGHPLHPVLTDFTIGAWVLGGIFDLVAAKTKSRSAEQAADRLTAWGTASALPTALSGLADYTTIGPRAMATGATHALTNILAFLLYLLSSISRRAGRRNQGVFLSSFSLGLITASAWLGGELVYRYRVGVDKTPLTKGPKGWTPVLDEWELIEQEPRRVEAEGNPVLLYRQNGVIYAIGAVCGHDGGPLDEGKFYDLCVECPWHQSVYDLRDGGVVHGPTTYRAPSYDTRVQNGKVELKLRTLEN